MNGAGNVVQRETEQALPPGERVISGPRFPPTRIATDRSVVALPPSFQYGKPTAGPWLKVKGTDEALVGDVLRITYDMKVAYFVEWQKRYMVSKIQEDGRFFLRHVALNEEIRQVVMEVEVVKPVSPAFLVPVIIVGLLAGALLFMTSVSIEKLGTFQVGDFKIKFGPLLVIGGLIIAFMVLGGAKGLRGRAGG